MSETQQLQQTNQPAPPASLKEVSQEIRGLDFLDVEKMTALMNVATTFSKSQLIPERFQGKPEDCFIGLQMAARMQADPCMVLQNLYVVYGTPGFSTKFMIAMANRSGIFQGPIQFETMGEGKDLAVRAWAVIRATGNTVESTVSLEMARAEGWSTKKGHKYNSMPVQMLSYRAACFLIRLYAPESCLGLMSREEIEDRGEVRNVTPVDRGETSKPALPPAKRDKGETAPAEPETKTEESPTDQGAPVEREEDDHLIEALESSNIATKDFLDFFNATAKNAPPDGFANINQIPLGSIRHCLKDWANVSKKCADWIDNAPE